MEILLTEGKVLTDGFVAYCGKEFKFLDPPLSWFYVDGIVSTPPREEPPPVVLKAAPAVDLYRSMFSPDCQDSCHDFIHLRSTVGLIYVLQRHFLHLPTG